MLDQPNVLFLNIGWARAYQGDADDLPAGKSRHLARGIEESTEAGESFNFKVYRGKCYGYSAARAGTINIDKLGAGKGDDEISGVLIVWTALNPDRGSFIVGWWRNATVFRHLQEIRPESGCKFCNATAKASDCTLLKDEDRGFPVKRSVRGWPGQSNVFFASSSMAHADLRSVLRYVDQGKPPEAKTTVSSTEMSKAAKSWPTLDPELRAKIEQAAIAVVRKHYGGLKTGWTVTSVEKENFGWDLEARAGGRTLRIEVKGRAGEGPVELTPNEYRAMLAPSTRASYRLAIVHGALGRTPQLRIFVWSVKSENWVDDGGKALRLVERPGAIASF